MVSLRLVLLRWWLLFGLLFLFIIFLCFVFDEAFLKLVVEFPTLVELYFAEEIY